MKTITKYLTITLHFYNLNPLMTRPLIDLDDDTQQEGYTSNIILNHKGIFTCQGFKMIKRDFSFEENRVDSIFCKDISENVRCKYIFRMLVCPKPSPVLLDDCSRKELLLSDLQFDRWNEYLLSSWWLHHIDVNGVKFKGSNFGNPFRAMDYAHDLIKKEVEELEAEIKDNL